MTFCIYSGQNGRNILTITFCQSETWYHTILISSHYSLLSISFYLCFKTASEAKINTNYSRSSLHSLRNDSHLLNHKIQYIVHILGWRTVPECFSIRSVYSSDRHLLKLWWMNPMLFNNFRKMNSLWSLEIKNAKHRPPLIRQKLDIAVK